MFLLSACIKRLCQIGSGEVGFAQLSHVWRISHTCGSIATAPRTTTPARPSASHTHTHTHTCSLVNNLQQPYLTLATYSNVPAPRTAMANPSSLHNKAWDPVPRSASPYPDKNHIGPLLASRTSLNNYHSSSLSALKMVTTNSNVNRTC